MKKIFAKIFTWLLVMAITCASLPISALAAGMHKPTVNGGIIADSVSQANNPGFIELSDGYITVKVPHQTVDTIYPP